MSCAKDCKAPHVMQDNRIDAHAYQCEHCLHWADKEEWGPGRIWCPFCKKRALSPAEK